jgi:hypothetical protein
MRFGKLAFAKLATLNYKPREMCLNDINAVGEWPLQKLLAVKRPDRRGKRAGTATNQTRRCR